MSNPPPKIQFEATAHGVSRVLVNGVCAFKIVARMTSKKFGSYYGKHKDEYYDIRVFDVFHVNVEKPLITKLQSNREARIFIRGYLARVECE